MLTGLQPLCKATWPHPLPAFLCLVGLSQKHDLRSHGRRWRAVLDSGCGIYDATDPVRCGGSANRPATTLQSNLATSLPAMLCLVWILQKHDLRYHGRRCRAVLDSGCGIYDPTDPVRCGGSANRPATTLQSNLATPLPAFLCFVGFSQKLHLRSHGRRWRAVLDSGCGIYDPTDPVRCGGSAKRPATTLQSNLATPLAVFLFGLDFTRT